MKKFIQLKLRFLAKAILSKYKPEIIGITGSVGKTCAKEAIYAVLSSKFNVRRSIKNYNNELGIPLTIINAEAQGKSILGWTTLFFKALKLIIFRDSKFPEIIILEMGIDRPGDMDYLNSIARSYVGVITSIGESHLEFFKSVDDIMEEKGKLIEQLPENGHAIINLDIKNSDRLIKKSKAKVLTYGFNKDSDIRADNIKIKDKFGISFEVKYKGASKIIDLPQVVGEKSIEPVLAGIAVGIEHGLSLEKISESLKKYKLPKGRMNMINGIKRTFILDDTYNSSPQSAIAAIDAINKINVTGGRKIAILGDMLELGHYSAEGHNKVGSLIAKNNLDKLVVVGERARDIKKGAIENGMNKDNIFSFSNSDDSRLFVQDLIQEGDLILIKGSQGMRMEKIVKEIMAEPLRAKELLVRQGMEWKA